MPHAPLPHMTEGRIFLIGVATVLATIGVVWLTILIVAIADNFIGDFDFSNIFITMLMLAIFGVVLAVGICVVLVAPMSLLWIPFSAYLLRRDIPFPQASMAFVGAIALLQTIGVYGFFHWLYPTYVHSIFWPMVGVPVGISVFLAKFLPYEHREDGGP